MEESVHQAQNPFSFAIRNGGSQQGIEKEQGKGERERSIMLVLQVRRVNQNHWIGEKGHFKERKSGKGGGKKKETRG